MMGHPIWMNGATRVGYRSYRNDRPGIDHATTSLAWLQNTSLNREFRSEDAAAGGNNPKPTVDDLTRWVMGRRHRGREPFPQHLNKPTFRPLMADISEGVLHYQRSSRTVSRASSEPYATRVIRGLARCGEGMTAVKHLHLMGKCGRVRYDEGLASATSEWDGNERFFWVLQTDAWANLIKLGKP